MRDTLKMPKKEEEERGYVMEKGRGDAEQKWKACSGEKQGYLFACSQLRMGSDDTGEQSRGECSQGTALSE